MPGSKFIGLDGAIWAVKTDGSSSQIRFLDICLKLITRFQVSGERRVEIAHVRRNFLPPYVSPIIPSLSHTLCYQWVCVTFLFNTSIGIS